MDKRASGVLMHVSSLWGDYSQGSFGAGAREWVDLLAGSGFGVWQVLPFCLPDECASPYKSHGAFSLNPYFVDLPDLAEQGLLTPAELSGARQRGAHGKGRAARLRETRGSFVLSYRFGLQRQRRPLGRDGEISEEI